MTKQIKEIIKEALPYEYRMLYVLHRQEEMQKQNLKIAKSELKKSLSEWFLKETGEYLNLNHPTSFNQKTQWLKLNDSTPLKGRLADKYLVREYITKKIGDEYLTPLLGVFDEASEVNFEALPEQFVLKATHGSGWNLIVKDKSKLNLRAYKAYKEIMRKWLELDFSLMHGFELHYRYCKPRIIAEKYLDDIASGSLSDYKVYCFNAGEPIVCVCQNRFSREGLSTAYYDKKWHKLNLRDVDHPTANCAIPPHLDQMIELSERLANGFAFCRVDWYESRQGLLFGELTFTSGSGTERWEPEEWARELGNRIDINKIKTNSNFPPSDDSYEQ